MPQTRTDIELCRSALPRWPLQTLQQLEHRLTCNWSIERVTAIVNPAQGSENTEQRTAAGEGGWRDLSTGPSPPLTNMSVWQLHWIFPWGPVCLLPTWFYRDQTWVFRVMLQLGSCSLTCVPLSCASSTTYSRTHSAMRKLWRKRKCIPDLFPRIWNCPFFLRVRQDYPR